jgi:hypothetical protein
MFLCNTSFSKIDLAQPSAAIHIQLTERRLSGYTQHALCHVLLGN